MKNKAILGLICLFTLGLSACDLRPDAAFHPVMDRIAPNEIVAGAAKINLEISVVNTGVVPTIAGASLTVYRSPDETIDPTDTVIGGDTAQNIPVIAVGGGIQ